MRCPACGLVVEAEPCAWGACPGCHAAHLCEPIERKAVLMSGHSQPSLVYPDVTEVWTA